MYRERESESTYYLRTHMKQKGLISQMQLEPLHTYVRMYVEVHTTGVPLYAC